VSDRASLLGFDSNELAGQNAEDVPCCFEGRAWGIKKNLGKNAKHSG
jgi:hypothetical protein